MQPVSELTALKIENLSLKLQQLQTAANAFVEQQKALIETARAEAEAPAEHVYNVDTRAFQAPA